jgi:hypothetical protein
MLSWKHGRGSGKRKSTVCIGNWNERRGGDTKKRNIAGGALVRLFTPFFHFYTHKAMEMRVSEL